MPPGSRSINQTAHKGQERIGIPNIELVIPKLASKAAGDVWLQVTDVATSVHQMRWSDAHQPLEYSLPEGRSPIIDIRKFLAIYNTREGGKALVKAISVVTMHRLSHPCYVHLLPL